MAKVSGPLMSLTASGGFASAMVYQSWKGRPTVRQLVIPANPQTADQQTARNYVRVTGAQQRWVNLSTMKGPARLITDRQLWIDNSPATFAWNGYLTDRVIGPDAQTIFDSDAAFALLTPTEKSAWSTSATALTPPILDVVQVGPFGVVGTPKSRGNVWYNYQSGLFAAGLAVAPGTAPPVYTA